MYNLKQRLEAVHHRIHQSAEKGGYKGERVKLVVVTKSVDVQTINEVLSCGEKEIGENRVQDFLEKHETLGDKANWHFIGYLQSNKVKYLVGKVALIHSLDRLSLAQTLEAQGEKNNYVFHCLVQVNVSGEESKHGMAPENVEKFLTQLSTFRYLRIHGLMTMAPFYADPEKTRPVFRRLTKLSEKLSELQLENINMELLSMGMSNDYHVAIEEGANLVRIGSEIFEER